MAYGVGIIGAGPGVTALHLPTLGAVDRFRVVHVSDAGSGRAAEIGERLGIRSSAGVDDLLSDPEVEVVAICSPPVEHAAQVIAAAAAGKRAVFCEKPLAATPEDAERAIAACRAAGTALVVGTNHFFDPAWERAKHHLTVSGGAIASITVTLALPPNGRYHELVSEPSASTAGSARSAPARRGPPDLDDPQVAASIVRQLLVGLAVHDLPLVRDLAPDLERVVFARAVSPIGYTVGFVASGIPIQLSAVMLPGGADALWRLTIRTVEDRLDVSFPPAFVHAGSAAVIVRDGAGHKIAYPRRADDGYLAEWRALAQLLDERLPVEYAEVLDDARYGIRLAVEAAALIEVAG